MVPKYKQIRRYSSNLILSGRAGFKRFYRIKNLEGILWRQCTPVYTPLSILAVIEIFIFFFFLGKLFYDTPPVSPDAQTVTLGLPWEGLLILLPSGMTATEFIDCNKYSRRLYSCLNFSIASMVNSLFILFLAKP